MKCLIRGVPYVVLLRKDQHRGRHMAAVVLQRRNKCRHGGARFISHFPEFASRFVAVFRIFGSL